LADAGLLVSDGLYVASAAYQQFVAANDVQPRILVASIRLVELMLRLEEMGITIPMESAWDVQTVGDAYRVHKDRPV
jgi:hypothetical protein